MLKDKVMEEENFDPAEFLHSEDEIKQFLAAALEIKCGPKTLARCVDVAIRAEGLLLISQKLGIPVEHLYTQNCNCQNLTLYQAKELGVNIRDVLGPESK